MQVEGRGRERRTREEDNAGTREEDRGGQLEEEGG